MLSERIVSTPSPGTYPLRSSFGKDTKKFSYTFGLSREVFAKVYLKHQPVRDLSIPGPGTYQLPQGLGRNSQRYSLRPRTSIISQIHSNV
ncbi:MAG: hypothetical protein P4M11_13770 [Candidatus Pacebacteria bacterium]|nr:hypothetical protein [Candidatus Paceibacterota bacterium]